MAGMNEERLVALTKRIYNETKQAIVECNFLTTEELDRILLTKEEEDCLINVTNNQASLTKAATLLRELHARFLKTFVLSAFDLTWDMITTPKRLEYTKQKELELYTSLMSIANLKQDEIKMMIRETIISIKQDLINSSTPPKQSSKTSTNSAQHLRKTNNTTNIKSKHSLEGLGQDSIQNHNQLVLNGQCGSADNSITNSIITCNSNNATNNNVNSTSDTNSCIIINNQSSSSSENVKTNSALISNNPSSNIIGNTNSLFYRLNHSSSLQSLSIDSQSSQMTNDLSAQSLENISSRKELQLYRQEIQELVLQQLNSSIASKLVGSVESLRNSYVGTLERCLASLERNFSENNEQPNALFALRQILNSAYRVEVSVQSSTSVLRVLWERMKQLLSNNLPTWDLGWSNYGCLVIDDQWKRQQALDILDSLSESRLAKSICSQFCQQLKQSHEQFLQSIKDLEMHHVSRLKNNEDIRLRVRKFHAPQMANFALESSSLIDLIQYGMPCLEREIGRGQYGVVYGCESWAGHSPCAVKSVVPPDDKHWFDLAMEFYYTRCIPEHERIVNIYGSIIDYSYGSGSTPAVLLIMERLDRDLYSAIRSGLDWLTRLHIAIDVVEGIRFLHSQGLVHRDIKLKNILIDCMNRAKITDLGFCKPEAMMSGSVVGTPIHMSPELFSGRYDNSVDVYAFGILFWYICAGHVKLPHIFQQCLSRDQLWNCVRRGVRPERLPQFDNDCWQLMVQCWDGDRSKRPHLGDVETRLRQIYAGYL